MAKSVPCGLNFYIKPKMSSLDSHKSNDAWLSLSIDDGSGVKLCDALYAYYSPFEGDTVSDRSRDRLW